MNIPSCKRELGNVVLFWEAMYWVKLESFITGEERENSCKGGIQKLLLHLISTNFLLGREKMDLYKM